MGVYFINLTWKCIKCFPIFQSDHFCTEPKKHCTENLHFVKGEVNLKIDDSTYQAYMKITKWEQISFSLMIDKKQEFEILRLLYKYNEIAFKNNFYSKDLDLDEIEKKTLFDIFINPKSFRKLCFICQQTNSFENKKYVKKIYNDNPTIFQFNINLLSIFVKEYKYQAECYKLMENLN